MKVKPTHLTISIIAAAAHIAKAAPTPNPQNALAGAFYPSFLPSDSGSSTSAASSPVSATFSPNTRKKKRGPFIAQGEDISDNDGTDSDPDSEDDAEVEDSFPSSSAKTGEGITVNVSTETPNTGDDDGAEGDAEGEDEEAEMSSRLDDNADDVQAEINHALCEGYRRCLAESKGGASCEEPSAEC